MKLLIAALVIVRWVGVPSLILGAEWLIIWAIGPPGSDLLIKRRRIVGADLFHGDALLWVDLKHLAQQIKSIVGSSRKLTSQRGDGLFGKLANEPFGLLRGDEVHIGFGELSKLIRNQGQLRRLK